MTGVTEKLVVQEVARVVARVANSVADLGARIIQYSQAGPFAWNGFG